MSRIRNVNIFDSNASPIVTNAGRVPVFMDDRNVNVRFQDSGDLDAFGRVRMSFPQTIFDNTFQYDLKPGVYEQVISGGGAISHLPFESAALLSVGTASGDSAILQSKQYIRYQPGKSQLVFITATLGENKEGVSRRLGYFDAGNGLFFQQEGMITSVVVRSQTSGIVIDTEVDQDDWNIDRLDGSGPSGITLDLGCAQIFVIDFEWLGVGRVRFGFSIDGRTIYCHEFNHANVIDTVYMTTANLPVRSEIENVSATASASWMRQFCASVMSEGGVQEDFQRRFAIGRGVTPLAVTTRRPVLSIRPGPTFNGIVNRGHVIFRELEILAAMNNCLWELVLNGTLTGASWGNVDSTSITQFDTAATAISGGISLDRGWAVSGMGASAGRSGSDAVQNIEIYNNFDGTTPDVLSIVCTSFTGTTNINALIRWTEQR